MKFFDNFSRKFMTAIMGALLIGLNDALGLGLDEEAQTKIVAILMTYIVGQGVVDAAGALGEGKVKAENEGLKAAHEAAQPPAPLAPPK